MRYWTVEEARAYLPRLKELVETIHHAAQARTGAAPTPNGDRSPMRDANTGLIDFHALGADGVVYFLCWRLGEDELGWWHLPEEGFPGRKPLPREGG